MSQEHQKNLERDAANSLLSLIGINKNDQNEHFQEVPYCRTSLSTESEDEAFSSSSSVTSDGSNNILSDKKVNKKSRSTMLLPMTLMTLLDDPSNSDVITFLPDGTSFAILQPTVFASDLMPKHFNMVNYKAFVCKLNRWGFRQVTNRIGARCEVYQHPLFRQGERGLCRKMKCLRSDQSNSLSAPISRASSPTTATGHAANLYRCFSSNNVTGEKKQRMRRPLEKELQDPQTPPAVIHDQKLERREPAFVSQQALDRATTEVLGAAFEVLARDEGHAPKPQFPLHLPALPGISSADNSLLLNSSLNGTGLTQSQGILSSLVGASHTSPMIDANALSQYVYLQQLRSLARTN
uniref:HSF-type DNA-binding domain-containing protein n=1 Tax=Helicotheca tamesis TaxID=374047 RepID=A0A7S2HHJ9_9STRA|mmetsp:Transcript_18180/g.25016  ORF Transcript_18180/g.25016 Transcript_18180/m.25016 type:complete len:352 (+) Transcript_18180:115-1170(+)